MKRANINLYLGDSLEAMKKMPDNAYDLAIVDPPYGGNDAIGLIDNSDFSKQATKRTKYKEFENVQPTIEYFNELKRVSKNQIIWGGNYFLDYLGATQCFLIWDKKQPHDFSLAMCEMAWTSFQSPAKIWTRSVLAEQGKIHPTQKPVKLYKWLLTNYAKEGDKILDTHIGSASIAIACHNLKFDLTGYELDTEYYEAAVKRLEQHRKQLQLF